jgi:hypothetical protein
VRGDETALETDTVGELRLDIALEVVGRSFERRGVAPDQCRCKRRPLPQLVVIGLGGGANTSVQLGLQ